jgi:ribosomal protein L40E
MFTTTAAGDVHIPSAFIVDKFICHDCGALDDYAEDAIRGELICRSCGAVNSERMPIDALTVIQREVIYKTYKRIHHFSERYILF